MKQDDIQGIRALYGERVEKGRPPANIPPTTTPNTNNDNNICDSDFRVDTIFMAGDGSTYMFSGSKYWKLTKVGSRQ